MHSELHYGRTGKEAKPLPMTPKKLAEAAGFEPAVSFPTLVFKTSAFGRSATPPRHASACTARNTFRVLDSAAGEEFASSRHRLWPHDRRFVSAARRADCCATPRVRPQTPHAACARHVVGRGRWRRECRRRRDSRAQAGRIRRVRATPEHVRAS